MAVTGTLGYTWEAPTTLEGLLVQSQSKVRLGKGRMYDALETTSSAYTNYGASIGITAGQSWDLGLLSSLSFEHAPSYEQVEAANVRQSGIWIMTEEEMTISVGLYQFNFDVLNVAFGTGTIYSIGANEKLLTVGDDPLVKSRPLSIETTNVYRGDVAGTGVDTIIKGILVTIYDAICTSGVPFGDMNAGELNTIELEFQARSVLTNAEGNRFASIYVV